MKSNEQNNDKQILQDHIPIHQKHLHRLKRIHHSLWFWFFLMLMLIGIFYYIITIGFAFAPQKQVEQPTQNIRTK